MVKGEIRLSDQAKLSTMMIRRSIRSDYMSYLQSHIDDAFDEKNLIINYILYYVMHKYRDARKFSKTRLDIIIAYINHFTYNKVNDDMLDMIKSIDNNTLDMITVIENDYMGVN